MKGIFRGFNPNLGEEFMQRHGGSFILGSSASPCSVASGTTEQPGSCGPNAQELEEDSIRAGLLRMLKVIHDEEQGRLRLIDRTLPLDIQDKLCEDIKEHAQKRRSRVLKK